MQQLMVNVLLSTCLYAIVAQSFQVIYRCGRFFHLAHAATLTLGAYLTYALYRQADLPLSIAVAGAIALTVLFALAVYASLFKPLIARGTAPWQLMIASLGCYVVIQNVISLAWGDHVSSLRTWSVTEGINVGGAVVTRVQLGLMASCVMMLVAMWLFSTRSLWGKRLRAVSENPVLATVHGISVERTTTLSHAVGTFLGAAVGVLIAMDQDMTPTMGFNWLLVGVVAMILGGLGSIWHGLLGSLLLATAQHLAAFSIGSKWMNAVAFIILIVFLAIRPAGIRGGHVRKVSV